MTWCTLNDNQQLCAQMMQKAVMIESLFWQQRYVCVALVDHNQWY